jgi:proline racemase
MTLSSFYMTAVLLKPDWQPHPGSRRITTVDMHTCGEPLRIFTEGLPEIKGDNVLAKRRHFREHHDDLRTGILWEPRGHADMYGAIVTASRDADFDVFFLHNEGYSTMCGHAIIALTTFVTEANILPAAAWENHVARVTFNVPAGRIDARATLDGRRARDVSFRNVPSFAYLLDFEIDVPGIGAISIDLAYGGAFYAVVDAAPLGFKLIPEEFARLVEYGRRIKQSVAEAVKVEHPFENDLSFLYGTIFVGAAQSVGNHSRNVCIFADGEVDRSPTGSGISARAAVLHARGQLPLNTSITIESIIGTTMTVQAIDVTPFGPHSAIIPEVSGTAFVTGCNEFYFDPQDPLARGFIFR